MPNRSRFPAGTNCRNRPKSRRRSSGNRTKHDEHRLVDYRNLKNPFVPAEVFSDDAVEAIHESSLLVLENLGMKVLSKDARKLYRRAGAIVDEESCMVRIGREIIRESIDSAPRSILLKGGDAKRDVKLELGMLAIQTGAGAPHATDLDRGRRPGSLEDFAELIKLTQSFDIFHMLNPLVEAQDVPTHERHYRVNRVQLSLSDKVPFVYSRGTAQVEDCFEMFRIARGLDADDFKRAPRCFTIINTNSPRQLDVSMTQGLVDFARCGQLSIVTPFCLMGAMAPLTVAGALVLSHAEAMAAIALNQIAKPGAPVCYGAFISNVDMKSGAPAFGTPEQVKANLGSGQLARKLGLPWRCSTGAAGAVNDAQAANETQMGAWGAILAGATVLVHGAGWIEGGLTLSYEKLITDLEVMQMFAELCGETPADDAALAMDALSEIAPGGHFFGAKHTMSRYRTAFYEPLVADWSNFGTWTENGCMDANARANAIWKRKLDEFEAPFLDGDRLAQLDEFISCRIQQGGAPPV
ncbi:MAG: trimethylamine methyltransferase family protein [Albidovulum sp.]|nr:trimethylamine methyltransferase family protein [Albidovulum sp.]